MKRPPKLRKRIQEVVMVFMTEGFQLPLARMKISKCASYKCRVHCTWKRWWGNYPSEKPWPEVVRDSFVRLGPAFVKAGQILSVRSDLIPIELADTLKTLQSDVPPTLFSKMKPIIEGELGKSISEIFKEFVPDPIGAGSIAQVYKGIWQDGSKVAIKVKRPEIDEKINEDLEILVWIAALLEQRIPKTRKYHPTVAANELMRYTKKELDFENEAQVASLIAKTYLNDDQVIVPKVFFSTKNLIVMEYIDGFPLDDQKMLAKYNIDVEKLVKAGLKAILIQIFDIGYFHGDPHPGNLHATHDGKIVFLDFGIFGQLDEKMRRYGALVLLEVTKGNMNLMLHFLLQMAEIEEGANLKEFTEKVKGSYHKWRMSTIGEFGFGKLVFEMFTLGARNGVRFPADLVLYSKAMLTIEGIVLKLAPTLNLADEIAPYFEKLKHELFSIGRIKKQSLESLPLWLDILEKLPLSLAFGVNNLASQYSTLKLSKFSIENASRLKNPHRIVICIGFLISGSFLLGSNIENSIANTIGYGFLLVGGVLSLRLYISQGDIG